MGFRDIITKISRWVLAALGFAAVSGCDDGFVPAPEYGVPMATFEVKCTMVGSETGVPMKGVKMAAGHFGYYIDESGNEIEETYIVAEATEHDGDIYTLHGETSIGLVHVIYIKLTDPDPAKDGHYKDSIYVVPTQKIKEPDQDEHWSNGTFAADVTLKAEQYSAN